MTKCGCSSSHRANSIIFIYSVLDNFSYFRGIWFLFNVNNRHRVSRDYFKMRFDLSERIIWAGPNTMIYFHYTWKKNSYCRIHHLWIRQSVLNVDNVIVIAALLYNNLAMTSPYWCPPSRLCLYIFYYHLRQLPKYKYIANITAPTLIPIITLWQLSRANGIVNSTTNIR